MQPRDWIAIVGLFVTVVGGFGALYYLWDKAQHRGLRMDIEQMKKDTREIQHRCEGHLREAGGIAQALKDVERRLVEMAQDIKTILRNGRNHA